jgi:hypothetical protein
MGILDVEWNSVTGLLPPKTKWWIDTAISFAICATILLIVVLFGTSSTLLYVALVGCFLAACGSAYFGYEVVLPAEGVLGVVQSVTGVNLNQ